MIFSLISLFGEKKRRKRRSGWMKEKKEKEKVKLKEEEEGENGAGREAVSVSPGHKGSFIESGLLKKKKKRSKN